MAENGERKMSTSDLPTANEAEPFEEMLCPHCLKPADPISHFCNACGGPTSMHSAIDPLGQIYTAGHAYRQATGNPVKFIVVLGVWLFFGSQVPWLIFMAFFAMQPFFATESFTDSLANDTSTPYAGAIFILFSLGLAAIYCLFIYKTTRGYIRTRHQAHGLCPMCKYDLHDSKGQEKCPECGFAIERFDDEGEESLQEV